MASGDAAYLLRLRLPDAASQLLERTSVRDGRLISQTFTPIRKDTRRDPVRLRDTVIDLVPDGRCPLAPKVAMLRETHVHRLQPAEL